MNPILLDISRLFYFKLMGRRSTGIDRVGLEYLRHYADRARAVLALGPFSSVLSAPDSLLAFRLLLDAGVTSRAAAARLVAKAYLNWWARPSVEGCVLLNTSHTGLEKTGYASGLRRRGVRCVLFVHDLIPITHPQYCRPGERGRHMKRMRTAMTVGRGVIVPSKHTLDSLKRFCGEAGLPLPPAAVVPLASSLPGVETGPRPVAEPYFVVLGTIEPRKNHILLLHLWRSLVERSKSNGQDLQDSTTATARHQQSGGPVPKLVIIGQRGWESGNVADLLERSGPLIGHVLELGARNDAELTTYLRHAQALLFPSFVEGYGLPLAEAISLGVPVIASDLPVFREVAGEIPEYADPLDDARWMELIVEYAGPRSAARAAQLARMAGFRVTTWKDHFKTVNAFLDTLDG